MPEAKWQFMVDRGGTFTDLVGRAPDGTLHTMKLLSENPGLYEDAAVEGIRRMMGIDGAFPAGGIGAVRMGTTVATNALLERKGEPTLLLITHGFADLLRIGTQARPRLFDLHIRLPELLYAEVAEVPERLDARGEVIKPLDDDAARTALEAAYGRGLRSVAITFMHGYLNPAHEKRVGEIAHDVGFTQITPSHEASKLIKLVGRGDTAVVDAYLTPVLRRYVDRVAGAIDVGGACERLFFMQSSGGLTDATLFQGRDAILSGPAGGVVGMVKTAEAAGFGRLIGFDMGGTSTDVCHYAGAYERSFETEVAGVRMRAPMMHIHTVAAGGGSILSFREDRYQVGPESAGADPGPACYRRGGPLTVTDCNVMLGKLSPRHFPAVFGPKGDQPLDAGIVREKFAALAAEIAEATGREPLSPEETAEGFLRIAVGNMAQAIKKISVERGYDVTRYTLSCFGGAGGQHACQVADALGMRRVFVHPFAGVLSAFGMGLADIRSLREVQFQRPLAEIEVARAEINRLIIDARDEVVHQGVPQEAVETVSRAHLRYHGSQRSLDVPFGPGDEMARAFADAHRARFGFAPEGREPVFDMLEVEAIGRTDDATAPAPPSEGELEPIDDVEVVFGGERTVVPLHDRALLLNGASVPGPAIIVERTGTNVIDPGWTARIDAHGNLVVERTEAKRDERALGTEADPIMLEVFNNLFMSIADQMGATLANTAYSVNIKERMDFSCALFDGEGNLVANAPHVPVHLGSMSDSVRTVARLNAGAMRPGDAFMLNAPFNGGTHLPDVTVITPVFDGGEIIFYVGSRGHHADIGGRTPGSSPPDSTRTEDEGVLIDNFKLVEGGRLREAETRALLGSGPWPCRDIDQNMADLEAQIAANATGIRELGRMIDTFGSDTVLAYMVHVQANAEASVRRVIGRLTDGTSTYPLDDGSEICVTLSVDTGAGEAVIDFTGTSPQHPRNYNAPAAIVKAVTLYVFRTLVGRDIPLNEGCLKPLRLILPEGSMINPRPGAAVIAGNTEVSQAIADCLFGALGVIAGSQGTMNNFVWGNERFQNYETIAGGTGAGPGWHGASGVHSHMTNTRMTDPEVLETRFPVRVERMALRRGSGGAGEWCGGDGIHRIVRFLAPVTVTTLSSHREVPPPGAHGGEPGACGENTVLRADGAREVMPGNSESQLEAGDAFEMLTPGGGGWGAAD
ncbi:hydantoinase B/oxoprolinase family protein [Roseitranquillus sediminis]|uniref:hydantoinase B/oxoprolinase family protein n=1 Tax=Roseitranquillus sediminis TaxID=2809051 RepID=UPI001D0C1F0A|nr:hydantoinase B/oxoprolinase family protein [Roseitranquillus sediminis]MBM9594393.1 hydantoinase B/oxoprolinase family protein [Roseitranquillus sediminis]